MEKVLNSDSNWMGDKKQLLRLSGVAARHGGIAAKGLVLLLALEAPAHAVDAITWGDGNKVEIYGRVQLAYEFLRTGPTYATEGGSGDSCSTCNSNLPLNGGGAATLSAGWNSPFISQGQPAHDRLRNQRSVLGFRGDIRIDSDLKGVWQLESSAAADGGGGLHVPAQTWANRDSGVGLDSKRWGRVMLGSWSTPYTYSTISFDPYYTNTGAYMSIMGNGSGASMDALSDNATFDRREHNLVQYWSPDLNGLRFRLAYEAGEVKTGSGSFNYPGGNGNNGATVASCPNLTTASSSGYGGADYIGPNPAGPGILDSGKTYTRCTGRNPHLVSSEVTYEQGPLLMVAAYEAHIGFNSEGTDSGMKLGVAYTPQPSTRLTAVVQRLDYKVFDGDLRQNQAYFSAVQKLDEKDSLKLGISAGGQVQGSSHVIVGYLRAGPKSGSQQLIFGPEHQFNKNFAAWAYYSKIHNEANAFMDFAINDTTPATGSSPSVIAVGLRATW